MSDRCKTVPTRTLYGTSFVTDQQPDATDVVTVTDGQGQEQVITSVVQGSLSVQTLSSPTATQFSTSCASAAPSGSRNTSQDRNRSNVNRSTVERSSTRAGGDVVIVTDVQIISSSQQIIRETQTPIPSSSLNSNNTSSSSSSSHTGAIAGGIVGGVVALGLLAICIWFMMRRKRNVKSSRKLDEFFSDPTATAAWTDKGDGETASGAAGAAGAAAGSKRTGTLRSLQRRKSIPTMLDLEKERNSSSAEKDDTHWAALTRVDSAFEIGEEDEDDGLQQQRFSTRPSSPRQSLNTLGRPLSFHSMSVGHQLDVADDIVSATSPNRSNSFGQDAALERMLLRNNSDQSGKSAVNTLEGDAVDTDAIVQQGDLLPTFYATGNYSTTSSSPLPKSPSSPPPAFVSSPGAYHQSPPLNEMTLHEDVVAPASPTAAGAPIQMPASAAAAAAAGYPNMMMTRTLRNSFSTNANGTEGAAVQRKPRTWSTGYFTSMQSGERPKSAQGLHSDKLSMGNVVPLDATFTNGQDVSPPLSRSPPSYAVNLYNNAGSLNDTSKVNLRGRASMNGVTAHYPLSAANRQHHHPNTLQRSPVYSPHASAQFPPSQYAHLDVHKTQEEREEDRRLATGSPDGVRTSTYMLPQQHLQHMQQHHQHQQQQHQQRRHHSLSSDMLLRVTNPEQQLATSSSKNEQPSACSSPMKASSTKMTPTSASGEQGSGNSST